MFVFDICVFMVIVLRFVSFRIIGVCCCVIMVWFFCVMIVMILLLIGVMMCV